MSLATYVVLVPVKAPTVGKSRLASLGAQRRHELAEAFALDTVEVALACPAVQRVVAITDDAGLAGALAARGCEVLPDVPAGGLNAALRYAAEHAHGRWPQLRPVALCADLPALRPEDLGDALARAAVVAGDQAAFVPDHAGTGTTTYTAPSELFAPHFGVGSREAHLAAGAVELADAPAGLRLDVDEVADLELALALGVGAHTRRATNPN